MSRRSLRLLLWPVALAGAVLLAHGLWIPAKAELAQVLLARAWERAAAGEARARPWAWADTWPVARLTLPARPGPAGKGVAGRRLIVLAGASGRTLAFGPGHLAGTAPPGSAGNSAVAGHRDTHFAALRGLAPGDRLLVEAPGGERRSYRVIETRVVREDAVWLLAPAEDAVLTLITCYPFDAVVPGGPLRWVVRAVGEEIGPA